MYDGAYWVILLIDGSHNMRHTGFSQVDDGQRDPRGSGCHRNGSKSSLEVNIMRQFWKKLIKFNFSKNNCYK